MMGDSALVLQSGLIPKGSQVAVFQRIFEVFLILGTIVGIIVIAYMMYNAYKYRADATGESDEVD
jgi:cytochrome c oxidase subunit 2